ncbi:predicted protein [Chaetoceros tenuissimus]|uniref:Uncharacterized protein n=1 Tax=Chaetoceros tenuissimus TaxID=426638 RepID=A0AAD3H4R5_9STRA|nr:predicted protein [Chaetoceros tenuissimus]
MYLNERRIKLKNTNSLSSIALYSFHLTGRCPPLLQATKPKTNKPSLTQKEEGSSAAAPQENLRLSKTSSTAKAPATPSISLDWISCVKGTSAPFQPSGVIGYASATYFKRVRLKAQEPKRAKAAICMPNRNSPKLFHLPKIITKNQQDDDTADKENQDDLDGIKEEPDSLLAVFPTKKGYWGECQGLQRYWGGYQGRGNESF